MNVQDGKGHCADTGRPARGGDQEGNLLTLNMGPQHPSTHGVFRLILTLDGETVVACRPVMGYLHRSVEKLAESRTYLMDRSEEHTSELQSRLHLVCRLLLEKKKKKKRQYQYIDNGHL